MAAPIDLGFRKEPTFLVRQEAVSLETLRCLSGFVPGEKNLNAGGNSTSVSKIDCTGDSTKYGAAGTIFSLDTCGETARGTTGQFHHGLRFNRRRLDCPIAIHDVVFRR